MAAILYQPQCVNSRSSEYPVKYPLSPSWGNRSHWKLKYMKYFVFVYDMLRSDFQSNNSQHVRNKERIHLHVISLWIGAEYYTVCFLRSQWAWLLRKWRQKVTQADRTLSHWFVQLFENLTGTFNITYIIMNRAVVVTANIEKPKFVTTVVTLVHRNMPVCGAICFRYPVRITCYIIFNIIERCLSIIWSDGYESSCVVRYLGYSRMCL